MKKVFVFVLMIGLLGCGGANAPTALEQLAGLDEGVGPNIDNSTDMVAVANWISDNLSTVKQANTDLMAGSGFSVPQSGDINFHTDNVLVNGLQGGTAAGNVVATGHITDLDTGNVAVDITGSFYAFSYLLGVVFEDSSTYSSHFSIDQDAGYHRLSLDFNAALSVSGTFGAKIFLDYHYSTVINNGPPVQSRSGTATVISGGQQYDCIITAIGSPTEVVCQSNSN